VVGQRYPKARDCVKRCKRVNRNVLFHFSFAITHARLHNFSTRDASLQML